MKWNNLKNNACPKCNKALFSHFNVTTKVFNCPCGFSIGEKKIK